MRPYLALWLSTHGLPAWLLPDYVALVGLAGIVGGLLCVWLARRDGADVRREKQALAIGYVSALAGGYVFEWIRALPEAIAQGSIAPMLGVGRAAYGGLLFGVAATVLFLRSRKVPVLPFLDRLTLALGVSFAFVRTGCFLAGCDYGQPTSAAIGVRFPPGSLAAIDHASRGFVPRGAWSLPVHPTQLYEAMLGVVASVAAWTWLRRGARDGRAFATWIATYAAGRFAIELLRGDADRGMYLGLSTAQYVSIALAMSAAALLVVRRTRLATLAAPATIAVILGMPSRASAQEPLPPLPPPPPNPSASATLPPPPPPATVYQPPRRRVHREEPDPEPRVITVRATLAPVITTGRADVPSGVAFELAGLVHFPLSPRNRIELGLETRYFGSSEAHHIAVGVPAAFVLGITRRFEMTIEMALFHNWISFNSPFFQSTTAWGTRFGLGVQGLLGPRVVLGGTPLSFDVLSAQSIGVLTTWEPRFWGGVMF